MTAKPPAATRIQALGKYLSIRCSAVCMTPQNRTDTRAHSTASTPTRSMVPAARAGISTAKRVGSTPSSSDTP